MKDSPAYGAAHVALYRLARHAGLPDTVASILSEQILSQFADVCSRHPDRAEVVVVRDHRSTTLAAENPALHEALNRG
jgi:hypothetical protein